MTTIPLSLYIHIPWCVRKCPYCDFNSHNAPRSLPQDEYVVALLADLDQDLALAQNLDVPANIFLGRELKHRYFGGLIKTLDDKKMLGESRLGLDALDIVFPSLTQPIESPEGAELLVVSLPMYARATWEKAQGRSQVAA